MQLAGPTRSNNDVLPHYFKRPNSVFDHPPPKRRVLLRSLDTSAPNEEMDHGHDGDEEHANNDGPILIDGDDDSSAEISDLKQEIIQLNTSFSFYTSKARS